MAKPSSLAVIIFIVVLVIIIAVTTIIIWHRIFRNPIDNSSLIPESQVKPPQGQNVASAPNGSGLSSTPASTN